VKFAPVLLNNLIFDPVETRLKNNSDYINRVSEFLFINLLLTSESAHSAVQAFSIRLDRRATCHREPTGEINMAKIAKKTTKKVAAKKVAKKAPAKKAVAKRTVKAKAAPKRAGAARRKATTTKARRAPAKTARKAVRKPAARRKSA
jgi:hypothetical protein